MSSNVASLHGTDSIQQRVTLRNQLLLLFLPIEGSQMQMWTIEGIKCLHKTPNGAEFFYPSETKMGPQAVSYLAING